MANPTVPVSLKSRGRWQGMSRQTSFNSGDRRFRAIINGYHSPDGTEIRSFPGWKCVVNTSGSANFTDCIRHHTARESVVMSHVVPQHLHGFKSVRGRVIIVGESDHRRTGFDATGTGATIDTITDDGFDITLTYSGVNVTTEPGILFNTEYIYVSGVSGTFAATLNDQWHQVTAAPTSSTVQIQTSTGGSDVDATASNGTFYKVRPPGEDPDALTIWSLEGPAGVTAPLRTTNVAMVANRQRDWGELLSAGAAVAGEFVEGNASVPRRKQRALPYRTNLEAAGDRVLIAAPGYGCVFQAPVVVPVKTQITHGTGAGVPLRYNDIYDMPRSLGVPKALGARAIHQNLISSDPTFEQQSGTYKVRIAFVDMGTGEEGLPSEEMEVTINATGLAGFIRIEFVHPAYYFSESLALAVKVYVSPVDAEGVSFQAVYDLHGNGLLSRRLFGLTPTAAAPTNIMDFVDVDIFDSEVGDTVIADPALLVDANIGTQRIAQMPMGCKAVRMVRGVAFFGGSIGDTGLNLELQHGQCSANFKESDEGALVKDLNWDQGRTIAHPHLTTAAAKDGAQFNVAHNIIPPAYGGQRLLSLGRDNSDAEGLYPKPIEVMTLDKYGLARKDVEGSLATTEPEEWYVRWIMKELVHGAEWVQAHRTGVDNIDSYLLLPRGYAWFSEPGFPWVAPSTNRVPLDLVEDDDIEAIGRMGNSVIFCSKTQTHLLSWANHPLGASPSLLSSEHGAIGASTMAEFDGGVAWIGDRGPVAILGGVLQWIGKEVEALFSGANARYLRDSRGLMTHSWATHDPERGLVLFGLRADRLTYTVEGNAYSAASDQERSRFPCDEVLVWSYRNDAWSIWQPPSGLQIFGMERILCDDGVYRMAFLAQDERIYALDDAWADTNTQAITAYGGVAGTNSTTFTASVAVFNTAGSSNYSQTDLGNDTFTRVGMRAILIDTVNDKFTFIGETTIASITSDSEVELADAFTWNEGAVLYVGVQTMRIETFEENWGGLKTPKKIAAAAHRYSQNSTFVTQDVDSPTITEITFSNWVAQGRPSPAFVRARAMSEKASVDLAGSGTYRTMGHAQGLSRQARTQLGTTRGQEARLEFTYYSGQQIRLNDVEVELAAAGS